MIYSRIVSSGAYLPSDVRTNDDLAKIMDTSDEWIRTRTGIAERHIAADSETCTDMCEKAALAALQDAGLEARDIDLIVVATSTPEYLFPSTAVLLQHRLACRDIPAFDVSAACSGFIYALSTADAYIRSYSARKVLVVGADLFSNSIDWTDRNTAVLFGDGAAAVILEAAATPGIFGFCLHSDGSYADLLTIPKGAGAARVNPDAPPPYLQMQGREVFKVAVKSLANLVEELLDKYETCADDLDYLVPHQANLRIIKATAQHLNMPMEKVILTVDKHANTSAASIPLALDFGIKSGKIKRGNKLLLEAFGGGFTWGGCLLMY